MSLLLCSHVFGGLFPPSTLVMTCAGFEHAISGPGDRACDYMACIVLGDTLFLLFDQATVE
jgi:hypothetical protein